MLKYCKRKKDLMNTLSNKDFLNRNITVQMRGVAMLLILLGHIIATFGDRCFIPLIPNMLTTPWGGNRMCYFSFSLRLRAV